MKTDKLFYEFFQIVPQAFFDLLRIEPACDYTFESPVVKPVERRMDGLFLPAVATEPCYFLEVQAQLDATIYWRMLQQITLYFVQRPFLYPPAWHAVILFLDRDADPGLATLGMGVQYPSWLRVVYLPELFAQASLIHRLSMFCVR